MVHEVPSLAQMKAAEDIGVAGADTFTPSELETFIADTWSLTYDQRYAKSMQRLLACLGLVSGAVIQLHPSCKHEVGTYDPETNMLQLTVAGTDISREYLADQVVTLADVLTPVAT